MALKEGMHNVCVQVDNKTYKQLVKLAKQNERSISGQIRVMIKTATKED